MRLDELIEYLKYEDLINFKNVEISGISYNSKTTKKGDIFICLVGEHTDGHEYAQMAIDMVQLHCLLNTKLKEYQYLKFKLTPQDTKLQISQTDSIPALLKVLI